MTTEVLPSMTLQVALAAFRYLVDAELRKRSQGAHEFREGCQEGYIASLVDHYGQASSDEAEQAYDRKETWTHVTMEIVNDHLSDWAETFENLDSFDEIDFESMIEAVRKAVNDYALKNPRKLVNALHYL
jgi:hypothetical protein